jgi:hypothetical protein
MIFAREVSDPLTSLVKKIDAATEKNSDKRMGSFIVFLTDEENAKDQLKALATKERIKRTVFAIDNVTGPPYYHIAKGADVTVMLYNRRVVEANFAFKKGELTAAKIEQIIGSLPKILTPKKEEPR